MKCEILVGDCVERLRELPAESVHCVVTSPPYDGLRVYGGHSWDFAALVPELVRVLVPGGVIVWIVADEQVKGGESGSSMRQALTFMDAGLLLHDTMIWQKPNFSHPSRNRYHQVWEFMFVLSKGRPRVFNGLRDRKNLYAGGGTLGRNTVTKRDGGKSERKRNVIAEFGLRHNVWLLKTTGQESPCAALAHPATFPKQLAADHIQTWTNPGDLVLDPFVGSGTTAEAALETGRDCVGIEIHAPYADMARKRVGAVQPVLRLA